ncbi:ankyrin repeat domain-containing protein [Elusimicrobiota bacterium]
MKKEMIVSLFLVASVALPVFAAKTGDHEKANLVFDEIAVKKTVAVQKEEEPKKGCCDCDSQYCLNDRLMEATLENDIGGMKKALEAGADPNGTTEPGFFALQVAMMYGYTDAARLFIAHGADANQEFKGRPVFVDAGFYGRLEIMKILLSAKELGSKENADVNAKDPYGYTALMFASMRGDIEVVRFLIDSDADVNIKNNNGNTALKYAQERCYTVIIKMLQDAGAR